MSSPHRVVSKTRTQKSGPAPTRAPTRQQAAKDTTAPDNAPRASKNYKKLSYREFVWNSCIAAARSICTGTPSTIGFRTAIPHRVVGFREARRNRTREANTPIPQGRKPGRGSQPPGTRGQRRTRRQNAGHNRPPNNTKEKMRAKSATAKGLE